jgi:hypothetical protein
VVGNADPGKNLLVLAHAGYTSLTGLDPDPAILDWLARQVLFTTTSSSSSPAIPATP